MLLQYYINKKDITSQFTAIHNTDISCVTLAPGCIFHFRSPYIEFVRYDQATTQVHAAKKISVDLMHMEFEQIFITGDPDSVVLCYSISDREQRMSQLSVWNVATNEEICNFAGKGTPIHY